jgi:transketolase
MHAGVSVGPDGATHQMLEDLGLMRMLPHMTVVNPCDKEEARKAVIAAASHGGPVYIRFGRSDVPVFTTKDSPFEIGKALLLWKEERPKIALVSTGSLSYQALIAARALATKGVAALVLHNPSIKPLDRDALTYVAKEAGRIITIEEHQTAGGFGSAVAEVLAETHPVPIHRIGVQDQFGQSGTPDELITHYGLDAAHIVDAAEALLRI